MTSYVDGPLAGDFKRFPVKIIRRKYIVLFKIAFWR
jgi:hypothetical protein